MNLKALFTKSKAELERQEKLESRKRYLSKTTNEQLIIAALHDMNQSMPFADPLIGEELWKRLPDKL